MGGEGRRVGGKGKRVRERERLLKQVHQRFGTVRITLHPLHSEEVQKAREATWRSKSQKVLGNQEESK